MNWNRGGKKKGKWKAPSEIIIIFRRRWSWKFQREIPYWKKEVQWCECNNQSGHTEKFSLLAVSVCVVLIAKPIFVFTQTHTLERNQNKFRICFLSSVVCVHSVLNGITFYCELWPVLCYLPCVHPKVVIFIVPSSGGAAAMDGKLGKYGKNVCENSLRQSIVVVTTVTTEFDRIEWKMFSKGMKLYWIIIIIKLRILLLLLFLWVCERKRRKFFVDIFPLRVMPTFLLLLVVHK